MKRYAHIILSVAAAFLTASCNDKGSTPEPPKELVFTASIEATKTTLDPGGKQYWEKGDEISINGVTYVAGIIEGPAAEFTKKNASDPDAAPVNGKYVASYPVSLFDTASGTSSLAATQAYEGADILSRINPLYAESANTELSFRNICGLVELRLTGKGKVSSIELSDSETAMSGAFTLGKDFAAVLTDAAKASKAGVKLDCGSGVQLGDTPAVFHVAVPAGTYNKLTVKVTGTDGGLFTAIINGGVATAFERSGIAPVTLNVTFGANDCLNGSFSVAAGKKVRFTRANACCRDGKWMLGDSQYSESAGQSLFFWTSESYGAGDSYSASDASELDWGKAFGASTAYSTLSSAEWDYLLNTRAMSKGKPRYSNAVSAPVTIDGNEYRGLFIYPDDYAGDVVDGSFSWEYIDASGIAFLPASGRRSGTAVSGRGSNGYYWTKDAFNKGTARYMGFSLNGVKTDVVFGRYMGYSVRLVRPVE